MKRLTAMLREQQAEAAKLDAVIAANLKELGTADKTRRRTLGATSGPARYTSRSRLRGRPVLYRRAETIQRYGEFSVEIRFDVRFGISGQTTSAARRAILAGRMLLDPRIYLVLSRGPARLLARALDAYTVQLEPKCADVLACYLSWLLRRPSTEALRLKRHGTTNLGLAREDFFAFPARSRHRYKSASSACSGR